jgi:hypothetical protein
VDIVDAALDKLARFANRPSAGYPLSDSGREMLVCSIGARMQISSDHTREANASHGSAWHRLVRLVRKAYGREVPADDTLWHPISLWMPMRGWHWEVLRRRGASGRWEYRPRPAPEAETMDRQW